MTGKRVLIVGWPGAGKTYMARELAQELGVPHLCTDPQNQCPPGVFGIPNDLEWSESSQFVANHLLGVDGVIEGVAVPRALRKWHESNPGMRPPADRIIWLEPRYQGLTSGQIAMGKGLDTIMGELEDWLGKLIERKRDPASQRARRVVET